MAALRKAVKLESKLECQQWHGSTNLTYLKRGRFRNVWLWSLASVALCQVWVFKGERKQRRKELSLQNQNMTPSINSGCISSTNRGVLCTDHLVLCVFSVCLCVTELDKRSVLLSLVLGLWLIPYLFVSAFYIEQTENPCFFPQEHRSK